MTAPQSLQPGGPLRLRPRWEFAAVLISGAAFCLVLATNQTWLNDLPQWFWYQIDKSAGEPIHWIAMGALTAILTSQVLVPVRRAFGWRVAGVWAAGYALQLVMAHTEGNGLVPLRRFLLESGHGTFVPLAIDHGERADLVPEYLELVRTGTLGQYAPTKPPGQLLLYVGTEIVSRWWSGAESRAERIEAFASFAIWTWPAIAASVVFPLAGVARRLTGNASTGLLAAVLYVTTPCFVLIQMHTDQVFFPLFTTGALWLACVATQRASASIGIATGVVFTAAVFCSFGLATYAPVLLAAGALAPRTGPASRTVRFVQLVAGVFGPLYLTYLLLLHGLGFDWYEDFRFASERHAAWKGWDGRPQDYLYFGFLDLVEYSFWIGGAVWSSACMGVVGHLRALSTALRRPMTALSLGMLLFFAAVLAFGKTKAEVARLWLFIVPVTCLFAAEFLRSRARRLRLQASPVEWKVGLVVLLQVVFVWLMKQHMDFH